MASQLVHRVANLNRAALRMLGRMEWWHALYHLQTIKPVSMHTVMWAQQVMREDAQTKILCCTR